MSKNVQIARGFTLDPDYVGGRTFALLAKKGAGKSYTARVMAEEFWQAKIPFVLLDPMGTSWGLRSSADGKGEGIPVAIFGGEHGDAPLERGGGSMMADLVVDEGLSMVLDMSELGSRAAERQFAQDFLERMYRRNRDLVHLLLDEADLFAPQKPQHGDRQLLGITENIVRRGRNRGVGITLISQRPAVLNKDVLTQVDGLVAMQITGLTDRKAINEWVKGHSVPEEAEKVMPTLAELDPGECWWWIPQLGILKQVKVRQSRTFDSSPTQTRSGRRAEPKSFADVDMGAIEKRMAATIERAKAEDPKELRKELARLKKELAERPEAEQPEPEVVEVPVLDNGAAKDLRGVVDAMHEIAADWTARLERAAAPLVAELERVGHPGHVAQRQPPKSSSPPPRKGPTRSAPASRPAGTDGGERVGDGGELKLKAGARRMLEALASHHPMRITRAQLATLAHMKVTGGTFSTYFSTLKRHGLIVDQGGEIQISEAGFDELGLAEPPPPQSPEELRDMWRGSLKRGAREMLDVLIEEYPEWLTREQLAERVGMEVTGGTFGTYLGTLRRNGLAMVDGDGVVASETLFLGAAA